MDKLSFEDVDMLLREAKHRAQAIVIDGHPIIADLIIATEDFRARAERAEQFVRDHSMPSCTNPTCDCVEARLNRAERIVERVRALGEEWAKEPNTGACKHPCDDVLGCGASSCFAAEIRTAIEDSP